MTSSARRRSNRNAHEVARRVPFARVRKLMSTDGAFSANSARNAAADTVVVLELRPLDVNWALCAELMNRLIPQLRRSANLIAMLEGLRDDGETFARRCMSEVVV